MAAAALAQARAALAAAGGAPTGTAAGNGTAAPSLAPSLAPTLSPLQAVLVADYAAVVAFACACAAIGLAGYNIARHLLHYVDPPLQKSVVRILLMVPIYALFSFVSFMIVDWRVLFDSVRDVYEALVVYYFLNLMLSYCGGENSCLTVIMQRPGSITHVWPLHWCLPPIALTARFLRLCKQGTLQFVLVKPVMAVLNLIMVAVGKGNARGWTIFAAVVYNVSYTLALYSLLLFYKATHEHPGLRGQHPVLKFASVKLVVFATYYQTVLIDVVPGTDPAVMERFNDWLLCLEMVPFAVLQMCAFSWTEFSSPGQKGIASRRDSAFDGDGGHVDLGLSAELPRYSAGGVAGNPRVAAASGGSDGRSPRDGETAMSNAKDIMSMKDVAQDAYFNFNNKYGEHVMLDSRTSHEAHVTLDLDDDEDGVGENSSDSPRAARQGGAGASAAASGAGKNSQGFLASLAGRRRGDSSEDLSNPFDKAAAAPGKSPRRRTSSGDRRAAGSAQAAQGQAQVQGHYVPPPIFDSALPTYLADVDLGHAAADSNPFASEQADPLRIGQQARRKDSVDSVSSFDLGSPPTATSSSSSQPDDAWAADFDEQQEQGKPKQQKKKKKAKGTVEVALT